MKQLPVFLGGEDLLLPTQYDVINPATEQVIASVSDAGYDDAMSAIDMAQKSFEGWKNTPPVKRGDILLKAYAKMREEAGTIAEIITSENGKPLEEAKQEVLFSSEYLRWFAEEGRRSYGETIPSPMPGRQFFTTLEPIGVVGAIVPWNFPANMILRKCAPALAAGCPVVLKPAPETPLTALYIAKILGAAGLPKGVLSVLPTSRAAEISKAFFEHPAIRMVSFTGSTAVGKQLMAQAANKVLRVGMELGGNAPIIVFEDADLDLAVEQTIAIKLLRVGGESCICANRIFVHDAIYDAFRSKIWAAMQKLKMGPGTEPGTHLGPLITAKAKWKIGELLTDAKELGAKISQIPANQAKGFFAPISLVEEISDKARLANEEIFGPVVPLYRFKQEDEVIAQANAVPYGLAAYLFTQNLSRAYRVGGALEAGLVGINDCRGYVHEVPMGGYKESGIGREGGREGLREYLEVKTWNLGLQR
ncbi:MAG: NAD-dependent succinate-semialdehyde dehydrogenase [Parachlamydiales bacterium]|nr:NAD-dependent succinate-semialdehyde dehydrogenase [Candidatus Acheromyda pituitae]